MSETAEENGNGRPTTALLYSEMGKLRDELNRGLAAATDTMNRGIEKFEERITARLEALAMSQSQLALKNAHDIGVLETRVDSHQAAIEKLGDVGAIAHDARNRVGAIEEARKDEAQEGRNTRGYTWQVAAAAIGAVLLVGLDHLLTVVQAAGGLR